MNKFFLKSSCTLGFIATLSFGCTSSHKIRNENSVGIIAYSQYALRTSSTSATDTSFSVITNQNAFDAMFISSGDTQNSKPNFSGQTAVAISVPPNAGVKIDKAAIAGSVMNIYASTCKMEDNTCPKNGLALVTTPKSTSVKQVQFFINGLNKKTIEVNY